MKVVAHFRCPEALNRLLISVVTQKTAFPPSNKRVYRINIQHIKFVFNDRKHFKMHIHVRDTNDAKTDV